MRTSAKILRTIERWLTWPGWGYAAPRHFGPWAHLGLRYYSSYPLPRRADELADPPAALPRHGG
jgi:hypothetical protein